MAKTGTTTSSPCPDNTSAPSASITIMAYYENNKPITPATKMDLEILPDEVDETRIQPILEEAMKHGKSN